MSRNSLGVVLSPEGLAAAERSEGSVCEPERSAAAAKVGAEAVPVLPSDSEVVAKAKRRVFTAAYKLRIVQEAEDAAATPGGVGALLRREGLYSSHLVSWRRERQAGSLEALTPRKRGRKSQRDPLAEENEKLRRQLGQLTEKLRKAEIIIDVQKKVAALLGVRSRIRRRNCDGRGYRVGHHRGRPHGVPGAGSAASFLLPQAAFQFFGFADFPAAAGTGVAP